MQKVSFIKTVSKGSRFNQIYIPTRMGDIIEVGDVVEATLVKKTTKIIFFV